ncbi:MAG: iron chelate uptake ABC transporter family permease subunit [Phycisphaerales bacterium]
MNYEALGISYTVFHVLVGSALLGVLGGVLGSFALLRRQSLLSDALAHAALPGVCFAFLLTGAREPVPLLVGALVSGLLGALLVLAVVRTSRIKEDTALGIVLSVFFGLGIVLLTYIQHQSPAGSQAGLDKFLFGQPAALTTKDLRVMGVLGAVVLGVVIILYKEFKLISFDTNFAGSLGRPTVLVEVILTGLLVVVIVIGLQTVGVVLMVATLITPAAAARQWTDRLSVMLVLAALIGAGSAAGGAIWSGFANVPTGPAIVLVASALLVVSLFVAPQRGIAWAWFRQRAFRVRIQTENLLKDLYELEERRGERTGGVNLADLMGMRGQRPGEIRSLVRRLRRRDFVESMDLERVRLNTVGRAEAEQVIRRHRLWELYLTERMALPSDHVHRDAEDIEHVMTGEMADRLAAQLGDPSVDPHGRAIPPDRDGGMAS